MEKTATMNLNDPLEAKSKALEDSKRPLSHDFVVGFKVANFCLGWFTVTLEVFIRRNFGERYLTFTRLIVGFFLLNGLLLLPNLISGTWKGKFSPSILSLLVYFAYIGLAVWHKVAINRRNKKGIRWHSRYSGTPWGIYKNFFSRWNTYLYVEPALCLVICLILGLCKQVALFYWMLICIIAIVIRRQMEYQQERDRFLDQIDAQIDGNYSTQLQNNEGDFKEGLQRPDYAKMEGWTVPPMDLLPQLRETVEKQSIADAVKESMV